MPPHLLMGTISCTRPVWRLRSGEQSVQHSGDMCGRARESEHMERVCLHVNSGVGNHSALSRKQTE